MTSTPLLRGLQLLGLVLLLTGCATRYPDFLDIVAAIDLPQVAPVDGAAPRRAQVRVTDLRRNPKLERTTNLGQSLGRVRFRPPEAELIQAIVQAQANALLPRAGGTEPQIVLVGIREFDVATPATWVYWDVSATIDLLLRVRGQDRAVSATATERTYVWPSQEMIVRVTTEALRKLSAETAGALGELFATGR